MSFIFEKIATSGHVAEVIGWVVLAYAAVLSACMIDLACGLYKAIKSGRATTSTGLRKTCTKAQHYFLPMLCLSFADVLGSAFVGIPPFTFLWAAFCIICEFKSVLENSSTKEQIRDAANTMDVVIKNKSDLAKALVEVLNEMKEEKNANN